MSAGSSAAPPKPTALSLQIKLPCATLEAAVARYGALLKEGRFFVRTARPRALETLVRLEAQLSDGSPCFRAAAVVASIVESPKPEPGMDLKLLAVDEAGRAILDQLGGPKLKMLKTNAFGSSPGKGSSPGGGALAAGESSKGKTAAPEPAPAGLDIRDAKAEDANATSTSRPAPETESAHEPAPVRKRKPGPIIGIDLGTSNVCVAVVREGKPSLIRSREGHTTLPAVVALDDAGELLVGHPAKSQLLLRPQSTVHGAKRLLGRSFSSKQVREVSARVPYLIIEGRNGEVAVQLGDQSLALEQISSLVLREAKELAELELDADITRAVITVPAYYSDRQRQAVREAGVLAGLQIERILSEPTAAALAFGHGRDLNKRVLVYDLGGGTFDASLLEIRGNIYEVLATGGDTFLGGVDFDRALVEHLLGSFREQHGVDFPSDRAALQRITDAAERAKIALSEQLEVRVREKHIAALDGQPVELDVTISRSELVLLTGHLIDRTLEVCRDAMLARGFSSKDLDEVLLVGGQSRMPLVRERLRNLFGVEPSKSVHPDEAVALGAAIFAHELETAAIDGAVLVDVLPMSIGVGVPGGGFEKLVPRNTTMPHQRKYSPRASSDGQTSFAVALYQGDGPTLDEAEYLGTLTVPDLPPMQRGWTPVELELSLDAECLLTVTARDAAIGTLLPSTLDRTETALAAKARLEADAPLSDAPAPKAASSPGEVAADARPTATTTAPAPSARTATTMAPEAADAPAPPAPEPAEKTGWLRGIFKKKK